MQAKEDLHEHTAGLTTEQIWTRPMGLTSLGFHLRHIAGSLDRLLTYLKGGELSEAQLAFLRNEAIGGAGWNALMEAVDVAIDRTARIVEALPIDSLRERRTVGRKRLPTTVHGLAVHIAEHTQRHVGQAIASCKLLRALAT